MPIYTRRGDGGTVNSPFGEIHKDHRFVEMLGDLDEAQAIIGVLMSYLESANLSYIKTQLTPILRDLSYIGSDMYSMKSPFKFDLRQTVQLEQWIDEMEKELPPLKDFVLPVGHRASSYAHLARTVVRRAERHYVALNEAYPQPNNALPFLNRLSDYLFTIARLINYRLGLIDTLKNL